MAQQPDRPDEGHPIAMGVLALVGVALVIGLILGLVVLAGSRLLGLGEEADAGTSTAQRSMYLPRPERTPTPTGPQITLAPGASSAAGTGKPAPTKSAKPRKQLTLSASTTTAGPMENFDLSGVYPGGEGAILQVQRFSAGSWQNFPVTASVVNETFQVPVATSQAGPNRFRVVDTDSHLQSNEVRVTIG